MSTYGYMQILAFNLFVIIKEYDGHMAHFPDLHQLLQFLTFNPDHFFPE